MEALRLLASDLQWPLWTLLLCRSALFKHQCEPNLVAAIELRGPAANRLEDLSLVEDEAELWRDTEDRDRLLAHAGGWGGSNLALCNWVRGVLSW